MNMISTQVATQAATHDNGRVIIGGGIRLPAPKPIATADSGKVVLGGGIRVPAIRANA